MKRNYFFFALTLLSLTAFSQKTIIVNGGQFGNSAENVNVMVYDTKAKTSTVIDTIQTQSVQDILIDDTLAYVAAQDSIVMYSLKSETRVAAVAFPGPSTKTMAISGDELLVGNWFGQDSANLYFFNKNTLDYIDTLDGVGKGAKSILVHDGFAYIPQNSQNGSFQDTLGSIIRIDIVNRDITDTIEVSAYTFDIGELVMKSDESGFLSINSVSNTITSVDFTNLTASNTTFNQSFRVGNRSQFSAFNDTLYLRMNEGIGSINMSSLTVIDSLIIDTVVTAFTFDTVNANFYVTQTDFASYTTGRIYDRAGTRIDTLAVGFSPEVIRMYYNGTTTSLPEPNALTEVTFSVYPNPSSSFVTIEIQDNSAVNGLTVFNVNGQLVMNLPFVNRKETIDVSSLENGIYFLQLRGEGTLSTKRIIVQ